MLRSMAATSTTSAGVAICATEVGRGLATFVVLASPRRRDAETSHLAVQVASLHPQRFRRARDIALLCRKRAQNVVSLEMIAGLVQRPSHLAPGLGCRR